MKKYFVFSLLLSLGTFNLQAATSPLPNLPNDLEHFLQSSQGRKSISEMKAIANDKNVDVEVAFNNYLIAKKQVSVARAAFNPITTGNVLGIAMGLNYLWAPIAIEAVLSIPMKIHDVEKSNYLKKASMYNLYDAREVLNNEMAHLYYDILTHEVILKSIDEEIKVMSFYQDRLIAKGATPGRIDDIKKSIINLNIQQIDIYNLYIEELASMRTLLSMDSHSNQFELAQVSKELDKRIMEGVDPLKLQAYALSNSNKYKVMINLHQASMANVKSVRWSILSFQGLNLSYKKRVQVARNEEDISNLKKESTSLQVKNLVKLQMQKFGSAVDVFANYNGVAKDSMNLFVDTYKAYTAGALSEDAAIEASIGAIRDFRNKVVAHYNAWSAMDDFSEAANTELLNEAAITDGAIAQKIEKVMSTELKASSFNVITAQNNESNLLLRIKSSELDSVESVEYRLNVNSFSPLMSRSPEDSFMVKINIPEGTKISGKAIILLKNGNELEVAI